MRSMWMPERVEAAPVALHPAAFGLALPPLGCISLALLTRGLGRCMTTGRQRSLPEPLVEHGMEVPHNKQALQPAQFLVLH